MDLWIRSQDKEILVKANALWIMDNQIWMEVPFYENRKKIGLSVTGHNHKLASYKTKERALEILDEIQNTLKNKPIIMPKHCCGDFSNNYYDFITNSVYEMPEE